MDGILKVVHEVHCKGCERPALGLPATKTKATKELLSMGWVKRRQRWYCAGCKEGEQK